jgi:PAS domain S-box-containing protein
MVSGEIALIAPEESSESNGIEILHEAVDAFRKRELTYREILEDLPIAIYTTDTEGRITYYNRACVELVGRRPELGVDKWCVAWKLFDESGATLEHGNSPTAVALKDQRPVRGVELVGERPDGSRYRFRPHPTPLFGPSGECIGAVNMLLDVTEERLAEERALLLAREVDHRSTNLLTVVQSLVRLTRENTLDSYRATIENRIAALALANRLVADARWQNVTLRSLAEVELGAFAGRKIEISGDAIELSPQTAQSLGMLIHELCTNAVKYGALAFESGHVRLSWAIDDNHVFMLKWEESGAAGVASPVRKNIGNAIILGAVRQLRGEIFREWEPDGLRCTFLCSAEHLAASRKARMKPRP